MTTCLQPGARSAAQRSAASPRSRLRRLTGRATTRLMPATRRALPRCCAPHVQQLPLALVAPRPPSSPVGRPSSHVPVRCVPSARVARPHAHGLVRCAGRCIRSYSGLLTPLPLPAQRGAPVAHAAASSHQGAVERGAQQALLTSPSREEAPGVREAPGGAASWPAADDASFEERVARVLAASAAVLRTSRAAGEPPAPRSPAQDAAAAPSSAGDHAADDDLGGPVLADGTRGAASGEEDVLDAWRKQRRVRAPAPAASQCCSQAPPLTHCVVCRRRLLRSAGRRPRQRWRALRLRRLRWRRSARRTRQL